MARLERITEIQKLMIDQLRILETMTPLDFLEFRDFLSPASGFQSFQFRLIENKLGLKPELRLRYSQSSYRSYLKPEQQEAIALSETELSLFALVEKWLERTPFLNLGDFQFWPRYRAAVAAMLAVWGFLANPIPVAWNTWMTRVIPGDLEAGGGLQVALIQFAITFGAFSGGLLFDGAGWWSPFILSAVLLAGSALAAIAVTRSMQDRATR